MKRSFASFLLVTFGCLPLVGLEVIVVPIFDEVIRENTAIIEAARSDVGSGINQKYFDLLKLSMSFNNDVLRDMPNIMRLFAAMIIALSICLSLSMFKNQKLADIKSDLT